MHWLMDDACLLTLHADTIPCSGLRAAGVQEEQLQGSFLFACLCYMLTQSHAVA